jgi:hypothetical protein
VENRISTGDIVSGFDPGELVEIRKLSPFGNKTLVEAVGLESRREIKRPLSPDQIALLAKVRSEGFSFEGDPENFLLGAEAERIRIAHQFDPLGHPAAIAIAGATRLRTVSNTMSKCNRSYRLQYLLKMR